MCIESLFVVGLALVVWEMLAEPQGGRRPGVITERPGSVPVGEHPTSITGPKRRNGECA